MAQRPTQQKQFRGFDLSAYGLKLNMYYKDTSRLMTVSGNMNEDTSAKIRTLGFVQLPWGTYALSRPASSWGALWNDIKTEFPDAALVAEGDRCADGSIMRKSSFQRNLNNPDIVLRYGNPLDGTPPAPREARVVDQPQTSPVAETPDVVRPTATLPQASNSDDIVIEDDIMRRMREAGIVDSVPENAENYIRVMFLPTMYNRTPLVAGYIPRTSLVYFPDIGVHGQNNLYASNSNNIRFASYGSGNEKYLIMENIKNPQDPENEYPFMRNIPERDIISFINRNYVRRVVENGPMPQVHVDNIIRFLYNKTQIEHADREQFAKSVGLATYLFLNTARDQSRNTKYRNLGRFASLDRSARNTEDKAVIPPQIAYALSRSFSFETIGSNWTGMVVNDPTGMMVSALPSLFENEISLETSPGQKTLLTNLIPIGMKNLKVEEDPITLEGQDFQIVNLLGKNSDSQTDVDMGEVTVRMRSDQADVISYVDNRSENGQSMYILEGNAEDNEALLKYLGTHYNINGTAVLSGEYVYRTPTATDITVVSVGRRRLSVLAEQDIPEEARTISAIENDNDMWSWSSLVIGHRTQLVENSILEGMDNLDRNMSDAEANVFQEPYGAMSRIGTAKTMIPKYHAIPIRRFQNKIWNEIKERGFDNVDDFVANILDMTHEELAANLSPEQIDMVAITRIRLDQPKSEGNAILNADNTGVGKTRENAAFVKLSLKEGKFVTYFTEYAAAFGAIYHEFGKLKVNENARYMTLNHKDIVDKVTKEVIIPATPRHIVRGLTTRMLEPNCNTQMTSYILSHSACTNLKARFKEALNHLEGMTPEQTEHYQALKSLMSKFQGNQITLVEGESIDEILAFVPEDQIKETHVDYPNYNIILSSYSQVNRPTRDQQREKGRMDYVDYLEQVAAGVRFAKKPKFIINNTKSTWMTEIVANMKGLSTVLDESHIAASDKSNMSQNISIFKEKTEYLVYASATWLKGVSGMNLYSRAFSEEMPVETISALMTKGDETVHETLTRMMVETGAYVRRELDTSGCIYNTITDDKYFWENVALVNVISPVMSSIGILSGEISSRVSILNEMVENEDMVNSVSAGTSSVAKIRGNRSVFETASVGSPMSRIENTINLVYLHKMVIDRAVEHLKEGRKPFITVNGTNESYAKSFYDRYGRLPNLRDLLKNLARKCTKVTHRGETVDLSSQVVDIDMAEDIIEGLLSQLPECMKPLKEDEIEIDTLQARHAEIMAFMQERGCDNLFEMMSDMATDLAIELQASEKYLEAQNAGTFLKAMQHVNWALSRSLQEGRMDMVLTNIQNIKDYLPSNPGKSFKVIMDLIEKVPEMPISMLDVVRQGIEAQGFSCGEITGRRFQFVDNVPVQREIIAKDVIRDMFNNGEYNAVIVNKSAASSLDMHAAEDALDQGIRATLFFGTQPDGVTFGQLAGRTNRNGQVSMPWYDSFNTGMPITRRELAILYGKLRSMYALSTSNRENSLITEETIDIMNEVGDKVCYEYLKDRPELAHKLGLKEKMNEAIHTASNNYSIRGLIDARKVSRCVDTYLPFHEQNRVIKEIETEYTARIEELNASGQNPLKPQEIRGETSIVSKRLISGYETTKDQSIFSKPVFEAVIATVEAFNPVDIENVIDIVETAKRSMTETPQQRSALLWSRREEILHDEKGLDKNIHVDDYCNGTSTHICPVGLKIAYGKLKRLCDILNTVEIGTLMTDFSYNTELVSMSGKDSGGMTAIVTGIEMPEQDDNHAFSANHYKLEFIAPIDEKPQTNRLSIIMRNHDRLCALSGSNDKVMVSRPESGLRSALPDEFIQTYRNALRKAEMNARRKYSKVLMGNELMATAMVLNHKFGNPVVFHTETGPVRGILITDDKRYNEIAANIESVDLAMAVLESENVRKLEFETKPATLVTKMKPKKKADSSIYKISLPSMESNAIFFEDPEVVSFAEAHFGTLEDMIAADSSGERVVSKLVLKTEDENLINDFVSLMFSKRIACNAPSNLKEYIANIRQDLMSDEEEPTPEGNALNVDNDNNTPAP